jgi:F-type H+-transporting ATPase subunit b
MHHYILANIAQDLAEKAQTTSEAFGFNSREFGSQIVGFLIVCAVLWKFAYTPVLKMLDERRSKIAESMANAEKIQAELNKAQEDRHEILHQANLQAAKFLEEAKHAAQRVKDEGIRKAGIEGELILAHAREAAAREKALAQDALKKEIGRLVVATAAQVTGKVLTEQDQERLQSETLKQLAV